MDGTLRIRCQTADGTQEHFKIERTTKLRKLVEAYCKVRKVSRGQLRLLFDGVSVGDNQTPDELGIEDEDVIDVLEEQLGG
ncbi:hypothetical protein DIPPA_19437 [Diplonema papillatum]|nr:hypothetical protein DIPPA_19437 [Diplonema papillatum]